MYAMNRSKKENGKDPGNQKKNYELGDEFGRITDNRQKENVQAAANAYGKEN